MAASDSLKLRRAIRMMIGESRMTQIPLPVLADGPWRPAKITLGFNRSYNQGLGDLHVGREIAT